MQKISGMGIANPFVVPAHSPNHVELSIGPTNNTRVTHQLILGHIGREKGIVVVQ